jgi:hypothetical protein
MVISAKELCYNSRVPGKKKKKDERPIFDSVRKPTAPPSRKIGKRRPEEKVHPSERHVKHKRPDRETNDGDI